MCNILNFNEQKKLAFKFRLQIIYVSLQSSLLKFKVHKGICRKSLGQSAEEEECRPSGSGTTFVPNARQRRANRDGETRMGKAGHSS